MYTRRKARRGQEGQQGRCHYAHVTRGGEDCEYTTCFPDLETSTLRQVTILTLLIILAIITAISKEDCYAIRVALFVFLFFIVGFSTSVHLSGKGGVVAVCIIIGVTGLMVPIVGAVALLHFKHPRALMLSQAVSLTLLVIFLVIFMRKSTRMHILITWLLVFPTAAAAILMTPSLMLGKSITIEYRSALLLPALTLFFYKSAAAYCSSFDDSDDLNAKKNVLTTFLRICGASVLTGTSLIAASLALDLPVSVGSAGFALAIMGSLFFNAILVMRRWENPSPTLDDPDKKWLPLLQSTGITIFMFSAIVALYFSLQLYRIAAIPLSVLLVCLYFYFVYHHEKIRGEISNWAYFLIILFFLAAPSSLLAFCWSIGFSLFQSCTAPPSELLLNPRDRIPVEAMAFFNLQCFLIFIYAMMTALLKSDDLTNHEVDITNNQHQEEEHGLQMMPATASSTLSTNCETPSETNLCSNPQGQPGYNQCQRLSAVNMPEY